MKKLVVVVIVAALIVVAWVLQKKGTIDGLGGGRGGNGGGPVILEGDDDRPPVVVSGGSVIIEQQVDAKDDKRGDFEQLITGNLTKWRAGHANGKNPKDLTVIIDNSTTNEPHCKPTFVHKKIKSLMFSYVAQDGKTKQFTATIDDVDNELQFAFPEDAEQRAGSKFRLTVPTNGTLTAVKIETLDPCALGPRGRVEMRQRK